MMNLDLETRGEKRVEPYNQVGVAFEKVGHPTDDSRSVDTAMGKKHWVTAKLASFISV